MMAKRNLALGLFVFITIILNGCGSKTEEGNKSDKVASYQTVGNFQSKDIQGNNIELSSFTEKLTLINFWATWCGPCVAETPDLVEVSTMMKERGVKFIGISGDTGPSAAEDVKEFAAKYKIPYTIVIDNDEQLQSVFGNVRAFPTTFLVNKQQQIVSQWIGLRPKEFFIAEIEKHLQ
ncbi:MAG: TlpA family protein disulfide reductase [Ignavibacteriales bacterium]|nr:TlpA family protein disulfide reductase [Ignavibacteriales bacterium]